MYDKTKIERISIYTFKKVKKNLKRVCKKYNMSMNDYINIALIQALENTQDIREQYYDSYLKFIEKKEGIRIEKK
jgi:antitoxin component of RelBE/YafQ-DinJ toxin-antitoxin module